MSMETALLQTPKRQLFAAYCTECMTNIQDGNERRCRHTFCLHCCLERGVNTRAYHTQRPHISPTTRQREVTTRADENGEAMDTQGVDTIAHSHIVVASFSLLPLAVNQTKIVKFIDLGDEEDYATLFANLCGAIFNKKLLHAGNLLPFRCHLKVFWCLGFRELPEMTMVSADPMIRIAAPILTSFFFPIDGRDDNLYCYLVNRSLALIAYVYAPTHLSSYST